MALARGPYQAPGSLCYLKYDPIFEHQKPFFIRFPIDDYKNDGAEQTNLEFDFYDVPIEDIRGQEDKFKFDIHGFELIEFRSKLQHDDFNQFHDKQETYKAEVEEFLKKKLGFAFVEVYDLLVCSAADSGVLFQYTSDMNGQDSSKDTSVPGGAIPGEAHPTDQSCPRW